jgi:hypothetical protein
MFRRHGHARLPTDRDVNIAPRCVTSRGVQPCHKRPAARQEPNRGPPVLPAHSWAAPPTRSAGCSPQAHGCRPRVKLSASPARIRAAPAGAALSRSRPTASSVAGVSVLFGANATVAVGTHAWPRSRTRERRASFSQGSSLAWTPAGRCVPSGFCSSSIKVSRGGEKFVPACTPMCTTLRLHVCRARLATPPAKAEVARAHAICEPDAGPTPAAATGRPDSKRP